MLQRNIGENTQENFSSLFQNYRGLESHKEPV